VPLTDKQMDTVPAGFQLLDVNISNTNATLVAVNEPLIGGVGCYQSLQVEAIFGP
jgi:hypothetical protein